jgi:CRP-like cAMP-binding protein
MSGAQEPGGVAQDELSRSNRLLGSLIAADFALLAPHLEPMVLAAGMVLQEPGSGLSQVIFPGRGTVLSLIAVTRDGRVAETAAIGCEGAIGGLLTMQGQTAFCRTMVQVGGTALRIEAAQLAAAQAASAGIRNRMATYGVALLAQVLQSVACAALHPVEARACRWLLTMQDRVGRDELPLTQEYLADMLGVRRTTVTRVVAELEQRGLIRHRRSRILVIDRPALEAVSCECHHMVRAQFERVAPGLYPMLGLGWGSVRESAL